MNHIMSCGVDSQHTYRQEFSTMVWMVLGNKKSIVVLSIVAAAGFASVAGFYSWQASRPARLAQAAMAKYSISEHLGPEDFVLESHASDPRYAGVFDFKLRGSAEHLLRIYVNKDGSTETHRFRTK